MPLARLGTEPLGESGNEIVAMSVWFCARAAIGPDRIRDRCRRNGDLDLDALVASRVGIGEINEASQMLADGKALGRTIIEF